MSDQQKSGLTERTTVLASRNQASCDLDGEAVILSMSSGLYHGLNSVGTRIWKLLQEPRTVGQIRDELLGAYEVDPATCLADLLRLLEELREAELIEVRGPKGT